MLKTLTFDNKNISDFHVKVGDSGIYEAPVRSVQHSYIPKKNGSFITDNKYFEDVIIFYQAVMTEGFGESFDDLRAFLSNHANTYFRLEDEFRPNHFRMAKYEKISGLRFVKGKARFDIYFRCKPQLFLKTGESSLTFTDLVTQPIKGQIIHLSLAEGEQLVDVLIDLDPRQEGGGTPSSTNIRPIKQVTGWNLYITGKNLLPNDLVSGSAGGLTFEKMEDGTIKVVGAVEDTSKHLKLTNHLKLPVGTYNLTGIPNNQYVKFDAEIYHYMQGGLITSDIYDNIRQFTVSEDTLYVDLFIGGSQKYKNVNCVVSPMIVAGSAGDFEQYSLKKIYEVNWGQIGVYGGQIALSTGVVTSEWRHLGSYAAQYTIGDPWISDRNVYASGTTPSYNAEVAHKKDSIELSTFQPFNYKALTERDFYMFSLNGNVTAVIGRDYGEIENPTLFESKPLIRVTGQNGVVYINDIVITVINSPYEFIDIDCELMKCMHENDDADKYVSFSGNDFPVLKSGTNKISVSTGTQAVITPRWYTL